MPIIDSQVHCYERNHLSRPWHAHLHGPPEVTGDDMLRAMDAVGVDGALLVSPFRLYGFDASYALSVYASHPKRFALIKPVDSADPAVTETVAAWAETPGAVGVRILLNSDVSADEADPGINRVLAAGAKYGLPVNLLCWGRLAQVAGLARRNPDTRIVIDHVGLPQRFEPPVPRESFADLDALLALAAFPNVCVKISGAGTLSHQPFPYRDIWSPLKRIFDAFGIARCLWGTDWTRAVAFLNYQQGVDAFRVMDTLTASERNELMGGSLQRVYGWAPG